jgi:glycosyltransferase involved in cell wall biosynthesis
MRISILSITAGGMSGGYAKHLGSLVPMLAMHPDVESVQLVRPNAQRPGGYGETRASKVINREVGRFYAPASRQPSRELVAALEEFEPDVLFIPNFRALFTDRWPVVAMVRNMETLDWNDVNDPIKHRIATRLRRIEGRLALRSAQRLIAVSGYVRDFLVEKWDVSPERVSMVYHGVDNPADFHEVAVRPRSLPDALQGFLFTAGSTKPSRGLEDLLAAIAGLPDPRPPLVVAGRAEPPFEGFEHELMTKADGISNGATIVWAGLLASPEMAWCYQHAELFVMTSRVEACPNIALEALSFGCPSIAADNKPLPEIYGDAAVYYEPRRPRSLAARLMELMERPDRRTALSDAARVRAKAFTWSRCAEGTAQALALAIRDWRQRTRAGH